MGRSWMVFFALGFCLPAFSVYQPGWERPVKIGELERVPSGYQTGKDLTMHSRRGKVTKFVLNTPGPRIYCIKAPCPQPKGVRESFRVYRTRTNGCGSKVFLAVKWERYPDYFWQMPKVLKVVDHSTRKCRDARKYEWDVIVRHANGVKTKFGSNPEVVYTIQKF